MENEDLHDENENDHTLTSHDPAVSDVKVDSDVVQAAVDAASSIAIPPPQAAPDVGVTEEMMLPPPLDETGIVVTTAEEMVDVKMHEEDDGAEDMNVAAMPSLTAPHETPTEDSTLSTPNKLSSKQERMDAIWLKHYKELQEYKVQNNHVRVPRKSGPLGEWVRTQRRYYKLWRRGESVPLNKERMEMLDQLGFVWLPAEEKVGGGFRGGRPKKRKREEEDVLNAVAAAAMVAGTDGSAAGVVGPNGTMFYNLAAPGLEATMNEDVTIVHMTATEGNLGDEGVILTAADGTGVNVSVANVGSSATLATAASVAAATPMTTIPYNFHQDPFYLHSMAKRADITNQISLLEKHESINRQQPTYNAQGGANVDETFKTQSLVDAHTHYEDVVYVLKRANEELRDAELALDRAKKTYDSAQKLKDKADELLANASEDVLNAELEDGDDEWIGMYKCLVNYKEHNGNILFPRVSNAGGSGKDSNGDDEDDALDEEVGDVEMSTKEDESGNDVSYGTVNTVVVPTTNVPKTEVSEVADTTGAAAEGTKAEKDASPEQIVETEAMDIECPVDTTPDAPAATNVYATETTVNVTEAVLHDWVARMRKFPKKQFKKWRRYALDKLGFVW